ncbi:MAG: hypothetical protein IPI00_14680 [Flavobacteriales bacterium]|nr:hypothetical protein [Flavobacteriales bacterium]MBK7241376.1 hypothetical protein [Flavobacteriales bacterium]MBK7298243.1 hypothetical protein [Flavobacteriales bacterium]MBK9534133.1 hypothetical protein [Flavobacteriales bacterium]HQV53545.1 hypothetical protein [Flavobacteriales bacterium]
MKNTILTAAFLLVSTFGFAQDKTTSAESKEHAKMEQVGHGCHMADAKAMESLNLTAEQKTQMEVILADCNKACSTSEDDAQRKQVMEKHQDQIENVLTAEQFTSWKASCDAMNKEHGELEHKEHMEQSKSTEEKK